MISSRGLLAILLFACAFFSPDLPGPVHATNPPFGSGDGLSSSRALSVRELRLEAVAPLLHSSVKQSQREIFLQHKAPDHLRVLVVGCDFEDSLLWGRDRSSFPGWPPAAREGNFLYDGNGNALVDGQGRPIYEFATHDSLYFDHQMRKARDYYSTVSHHRFDLEWEVHHEPVNIPGKMGYYGEDLDNSLRLVEMAQQVVSAIEDEVDFSGFDTLVLIHAGAGQETDINNDSPEQILSNYLDPRDFEEARQEGLLEEAGIRTRDGSLIRHVLVLPETETQDPLKSLGLNGFFGMRGVYCFEFGLRLGMLSLADFTPSGRPDSQGIGDYGLMGYGLFTGLGIIPAAPCAMNRVLMGWDEAVVIDTPGRVELPPVEAGEGDTLIVKVPITDREYWLLEYRLQDPDGTFTYSFADLNGNRVPDFYDADSDSLDGQPTSSYDPLTDTWESTEDSEWDYFMSEFPVTEADGPARGPGRGNGLYVWHIDERVIRDALDANTSTINADPLRKGVDLEEADGIQDLDSFTASRFLLGWDRDCFRGEGVMIGEVLYGTRFTADTLPDSRSADGAVTGFSISEIDSVQIGAEGCEIGPDCPLGGRFLYRQRLGFTLGFADSTLPPGISLKARRTLPADGPLGDVRLADLDGDGSAEIVMAAAGGALLAYRGDLSPWKAQPDSVTVGLLARARGSVEQPERQPRWLGAPVVGDLDGDGQPEFFLSAAEGIYAFDLSGAELRDGDGDSSSFGLFLPAPQMGGAAGVISHPALFAPHDGNLEGAVSTDRVDLVMIYRATDEDSSVRARRYEWDGDSEPVYHESSDTSDGSARRGILGWGMQGSLVLYVGGPLGGDGQGIRLDTLLGKRQPAAVARSQDFETPPVFRPVFPSPSVLVGYRARPDASENWAMVDTLGFPTIEAGFEANRGQRLEEPWSALAAGPMNEGGEPLFALGGGDALWLLDRNMAQLRGGPYRPAYEGAKVSGGVPVSPLLVDLDGDGVVEVLWPDRVGRIHAVDLTSAPLEGWPILGPGEPTGSPACADIDGDGFLEFVAVAGFDALVGMDEQERLPVLWRKGEIRVYGLAAPATAFAPWSQGQADAWATGRQPVDSRSAGSAAGGELLEENSLFVYPNPVDTPAVRLRAGVHRAGLVSAAIYDLQGQLLARSGPIQAGGAGQIEFEFNVEDLVSGLYLARVEAEDTVLVRAFAVVK